MTFSFCVRKASMSTAGRGKVTPQSAEVFGLGHALGHVQQGLRGDAAAQQADAAQTRFEVDQGDLHSQISGPEGGGVAARSAADDDKLGVHGKGIRD